MNAKKLRDLLDNVNEGALIYVQNQDAEVFPSCERVVDDDGNHCVTLFAVEQDYSVWDES